MTRPQPTALSDFGIKISRMADIMRAVVAETGVPPLIITSRRRSRSCARPRQMFCWVARNTTLHSLPEIGNYINRDHTTVLYACHVIDKLRETDPEIREATDAILWRVTAAAEEHYRRLELVRERIRG